VRVFPFHAVPAGSPRGKRWRVVGSAEVRVTRVRMGRRGVSCMVGWVEDCSVRYGLWERINRQKKSKTEGQL
jgi:hypothetical protein